MSLGTAGTLAPDQADRYVKLSNRHERLYSAVQIASTSSPAVRAMMVANRRT